MPSSGSFLKWSFILKHLQNQPPLNDLHEASLHISSSCLAALGRDDMESGRKDRSLAGLSVLSFLIFLSVMAGF